MNNYVVAILIGVLMLAVITSGVEIADIDQSAETFIIKNNGIKTILMDGWKLVSIKGDGCFTFLEGFKLKPGEKIKITSSKNIEQPKLYTIKLPQINFWGSGSGARLYNAEHELVSEFYNKEN
jgi:hypothetical protein